MHALTKLLQKHCCFTDKSQLEEADKTIILYLEQKADELAGGMENYMRIKYVLGLTDLQERGGEEIQYIVDANKDFDYVCLKLNEIIDAVNKLTASRGD